MTEGSAADTNWHAGNAGLNQDDLDHISPDERQAFLDARTRTVGRDRTGMPLPYGPMFFADHGMPGPMKRYRLLVTSLINNNDPLGDRSFYPMIVGELVRYCEGGFREGVRFTVEENQVIHGGAGLTRDEILEAMALAFWWSGSRGMREVQAALEGYEWKVPARPPLMPPGWTADPAAFRSGLDFSTPDLPAEERARVEAWYLKYEGEVPSHIRLLAKHRPRALKAWRNRFENTLRILPKQWAPFAMIHVNVQRGYGPGIREGVLLGRGFGMTKEQVLWAAGCAVIYGGIETLALLEEVAGDVLDHWR